MGGFAGTPRFEVLAQLGRGGMGVVYRARDRERATVVAIKTLRRLEPETVLRLKIEFRSLQDLEHPNLVSLGELFEAEGQWFYTMELVDGVDFLAWVRPGADGAFEATTRPSDLSSSPVGMHTTGGEVDEGRLRDALAQLAAGLGALHAAGKVHRDVKPSNVLVDGDGRVVLLDFGLVSDIAEDDLSDHRVVGTTSYMAPEQAVSASVGPAADWYSVGVMLHQALTGALPFSGPPLKVLMDKQRHEPPPPRALLPSIPRDLDRLCSELLRIDPARRPAAAEVLERLHGRASRPLRAASSAPSLGPTPPFVGRAAELGELRAAAAAVTAGRPVAVIVHGDSGVGKSALLRHFTEELARDRPDTVVLAGRCYERESVPFKAVDGVIDALARHLMRMPRAEVGALLPRRAGLVAQVFPVLGRVEAFAAAPRLVGERLDPLELRTRLFAAVRELLVRLTDRSPLVLVIDDLQWADVDSLELLADVLQPPDGPGLLLLATARAGDPPTGVDARLLRVDALPPAEALELTGLLAERLGQGGDAPALATIAAEAGGHPLFIDELIRHALLGGRPGRLDLDDALWARISKLDDGERRVLTLCAVAGAPLAQEVAARAAELALAELQRMVAVLRVANLVRTRGPRPTDTIEAYHDRVRAAVVARLDAEAVRAGHERLALALETAERPDAEALALHWREAGRPDQAGRHALVAAEQAAAALAFDRAARLYQTAVELAPAGTDLTGLHTRLGDALANAGRGAGAAAAYLAAAGDAATAEALELRRRAADQLLRSGHIDEGLAALDDVLAAVGLRLPRSPGRALWSLALRRAHVRLRGLRHRRRDAGEVPPRDLTRIDVCWSAASGLGMVDHIRGADFNSRHLILALRAGEPLRLARALAVESAFAAAAGGRGVRRAERLLERAQALTTGLDASYARAMILLSRGIVAFVSDRWRPARELCERAEADFRDHCIGAAWEVDSARLFSLWALHYEGAWDELSRRLPAALREAELRGDLYAITQLRTGLPLCAWLAQDDPEGARAEADGAMRGWSQRGFHLQHFYDLIARTQIDLYAGDVRADPLARLRETWPAMRASFLLRIGHTMRVARHMRGRAALLAASAGGEVGAALRQARRDARALLRHRMPSAHGWGELLRAGVAAAGGDAARALRSLEIAADSFAAADMGLYAAAARRRHGELEGGDAGRALVAAADAWMVAHGVASPERTTALLAPGFRR